MYDKQSWNTEAPYDYVTPTRMNHIEDGIYNASVSQIIAQKGGNSRTYTSLLNAIFSEISQQTTQTLNDGYLQVGGIYFRLTRTTSGVYMYGAEYLANDGSTNIVTLRVMESGSMYNRVTITSAGAVSSTNMSSNTTTDVAYLYGRI